MSTSILTAIREIHHRVGRPSIAECSCGLIICDTLRVLEGRKPGDSR